MGNSDGLKLLLRHFGKLRMTKALVMRLSDFTKAFEITCYASGIGIGGVLS